MSVKDFKLKFNIPYVQSESYRDFHKKRMSIKENNPTTGKKRTDEDLRKISVNRCGKGIGVAGKYERTNEIKGKISEGVAEAHLRGDFDGLGGGRIGIRSAIFSKKANKEIIVRSNWERRFVEILDLHPRITHVEYEPFYIPYIFNGVKLNYIPDFLITYDGVIKSIWEIKREDQLANDPKTIAKIEALKNYCHDNDQMNVFLIDLKTIIELEKYIKGLPLND